MTKYELLRLNHRPGRDLRVTTHALLTARALGCAKAYYTGVRDVEMEERIRRISEQWGGEFKVEHVNSWKRLIKDYDGEVIHLTMYGVPIQEFENNDSNKLIIVGGCKVPGEVYDLVDYNVSVTNQPHSEIAALALALRELQGTRVYEHEFRHAERIIQPHPRKKIVKTN